MEIKHLEIPIFPIPHFVPFSNDTFEFHVFEPRFRKMVTDTLASGSVLGIAFAEKQLTPKVKLSEEQKTSLRHNLEIHLPATVFCSGQLSLIERFLDGRMLVKVSKIKRMRFHTMVQTLPYMVVSAYYAPEKIEDIEKARKAYEYLLSQLKILFGSKFQLSPFSYEMPTFCVNSLMKRVAKSIQFDPSLAQLLLEQDCLESRMAYLSDVLDNVITQLKLKDLSPMEKPTKSTQNSQECKVFQFNPHKKSREENHFSPRLD